MHFRTEIRNVTIVNEGRTFLGSLLIDDDRIDRITEGEVCDLRTPADKVIDGTGCFLLPGIIDTHVHFRDPGLTRKGDFFSESKAAAAGGVTTVFDIFNCVWTLPTNDIETFNDTVRLYHDFADEPLRRMILGAVTLSVLRCFDKRRIEFLFDVYADPSSSDGAAIQALVGIFVAAFRHTDRFNLSTSIDNRMKQLADSPNAINDIKRIIIQFMKSVLLSTQRSRKLTTYKDNIGSQRQIIVPNLVWELTLSMPGIS